MRVNKHIHNENSKQVEEESCNYFLVGQFLWLFPSLTDREEKLTSVSMLGMKRMEDETDSYNWEAFQQFLRFWMN